MVGFLGVVLGLRKKLDFGHGGRESSASPPPRESPASGSYGRRPVGAPTLSPASRRPAQHRDSRRCCPRGPPRAGGFRQTPDRGVRRIGLSPWCTRKLPACGRESVGGYDVMVMHSPKHCNALEKFPSLRTGTAKRTTLRHNRYSPRGRRCARGFSPLIHSIG